MNRTLTELRARLGSPARFHIDAEPARRKRAVITTVRWACGCRAEGPGLSLLALTLCRLHAELPAAAGVPRPRFASLLGRLAPGATLKDR